MDIQLFAWMNLVVVVVLAVIAYRPRRKWTRSVTGHPSHFRGFAPASPKFKDWRR